MARELGHTLADTAALQDALDRAGLPVPLKPMVDIDHGDVTSPDPAERDGCYFLAQGLRARLAKELPATRAQLGGGETQLAHRAKALLTELAEISVEAAQLVVAGAQDGVNEDGSDARLPSWFMVEGVRDLPRLAAARDGVKV